MKIKIRLGFDKELDGYDPDEVIAITFAEAKLNSIQARGGTLSNRFGVAKTANNKRVLGVLDEVRNQDNIPYQRHDCAVEVDGIPVFYGFALVEESSNKYYLRVYSGVSNFFEQVGDTLITEVDLSDYDHNYNAGAVNSRRQATSDEVYPNINYGRFTGQSAASTWSYDEFVPALYLKALFDSIVADYGYTMTNYSDGGRVIAYSREKFAMRRSIRVKAVVTQLAGDTLTIGGADISTQIVDFQGGVIDRTGAIVEDITVLTKDYTQFDFTSGITGQVFVRASLTVSTGANSGDITIGLNESTTVFTSVDIPPNTSSQKVLLQGEFTFDNGGAVFYIRADGTSSDTITIEQGSFMEVTDGYILIEDGASTPWNGVYIEDHLPDLKIKDLFLHEAAHRNALVVVDPNAKTIEFVSFNDIAALYPVAKDWSEKIDFSDEPKIEFRLPDYGQSNYLRYKAGPAGDKPNEADSDLGTGIITIADTGLPISATLYTSPFVASGISEGFISEPYMMFIPRFTETTVDVTDADIDPGPRIVTLEVNNSLLIDITGQSTLSTQANATFEGFREVVDTNYTALFAALTKTKIAEVLVRLNAVDILELDFTKPVYLLNEYWFIREVMQWKANRADSTIVKLLRL